MASEQDIENRLIQKLESLKYSYRPDICDKEALELWRVTVFALRYRLAKCATI